MHFQDTIWIILGFILILSELFLNGFIVVFFGTSAIAVGVSLWIGILPSGHGIPLFTFIALTVVQIFTLRRILKRVFQGKLANQSGDIDEDFVGKTGFVIDDFSSSPDSGGSYYGRVSYRGTDWSAKSETPMTKGLRVTIQDRNGSTLQVIQS